MKDMETAQVRPLTLSLYDDVNVAIQDLWALVWDMFRGRSTINRKPVEAEKTSSGFQCFKPVGYELDIKWEKTDGFFISTLIIKIDALIYSLCFGDLVSLLSDNGRWVFSNSPEYRMFSVSDKYVKVNYTYNFIQEFVSAKEYGSAYYQIMKDLETGINTEWLMTDSKKKNLSMSLQT